ncbi:M28 family peptidase [Rugosimonospora acidiphila]|uniref:M28 family peptidase n=1 Tax=Rugosimonospora acidiphila TaxID=556531 RepID=UPI0031F065F4
MVAAIPGTASGAPTSPANPIASTAAFAELPAPTGLGLPRDGASLYLPDEAYPHFPMPNGSHAYAHLDGRAMKKVVDQITGFSRQARDAGVQNWGRIPGTPYERMTLDWVLHQFQRIGLHDAHQQDVSVQPLWFAHSWQAECLLGTNSVPLHTTFPIDGTVGTSPDGVTADAMWVGLGTTADFAGRDVAGKAVFIYSILTPGGRSHSADRGAIDRANAAGAAMVFVVMGMPGNAVFQPMGGGGTVAPTFTISPDEGNGIGDILGSGQQVRIRLTADIGTSEALRTNVWGTLPGRTDEEILVMAHTDAIFEGALDNAAGLTMMLEIAKHYAGLPKAKRRRRMTFLTTPDHHHGAYGVHWVRDNHDFTNTALIINSEHPSQTLLYLLDDGIMTSNAISARRWFAGGSEALQQLVYTSLRDYGVSVYAQPEERPGGELSSLYQKAPSFHIIDHVIYHSTLDTAALVPAWGLENATAAFLRIIDTANGWDIGRLRA